MSLKRRSYEAGHKPKFLVVIDQSPECDRAVYYASRRAARTNASVVMLLVIEPHDRHQQWLGVADIMKAEAHEAADLKLDEFAARANGVAGITPDRVIRDGEKAEQILKLIDEDEDIAILVLAAGTGKDGPGPLVASVGKSACNYPIPVAIVPGHLGDEDPKGVVRLTPGEASAVLPAPSQELPPELEHRRVGHHGRMPERCPSHSREVAAIRLTPDACLHRGSHRGHRHPTGAAPGSRRS